MGALHKFPGAERPVDLLASPRPAPELETFEGGDVRELVGVLEHIITGTRSLLDLLNSDRELVRQAGLESIAIEMRAILEGEKFDRVVDAVYDGYHSTGAVSISREGLARVRRLEALLAEATRNIRIFGGSDLKFAQIAKQRSWARAHLDGSTKEPSTFDPLLMGSIIVFGVIGISLIVYAAASGRK